MHPADIRFHRELTARLTHELLSRSAANASGAGVADWADYQYKIGFRAALVEALSIAGDIEDEMMDRKREQLGEDRKFPD